MTNYQYDMITFDCYGTLIDWESGIVNAFKTEAAGDGVELDPDRIVAAYAAEERSVESEGYRPYRDVLAETARRAAGRLGWNVSPERASFLAESLAAWKPFPDTNPALERLANKYKLGILSNVDDDLLAATRRHLTVNFDLIVTAQQVRSYKPSLAHFNEAVARSGDKRLLHAAQSYFHDVVPASRLGIPVVWVNRKGEQIERTGPLPTREVRDLMELAELLGG
ncbi:MAG TPA: HAD family hydrolase [Blastocatellia bacterium]|nr:HAD family hydrolase [Blastocatellia bacterium]